MTKTLQAAVYVALLACVLDRGDALSARQLETAIDIIRKAGAR